MVRGFKKHRGRVPPKDPHSALFESADALPLSRRPTMDAGPTETCVIPTDILKIIAEMCPRMDVEVSFRNVCADWRIAADDLPYGPVSHKNIVAVASTPTLGDVVDELNKDALTRERIRCSLHNFPLITSQLGFIGFPDEIIGPPNDVYRTKEFCKCHATGINGHGCWYVDIPRGGAPLCTRIYVLRRRWRDQIANTCIYQLRGDSRAVGFTFMSAFKFEHQLTMRTWVFNDEMRQPRVMKSRDTLMEHIIMLLRWTDDINVNMKMRRGSYRTDVCSMVQFSCNVVSGGASRGSQRGHIHFDNIVRGRAIVFVGDRQFTKIVIAPAPPASSNSRLGESYRDGFSEDICGHLFTRGTYNI